MTEYIEKLKKIEQDYQERIAAARMQYEKTGYCIHPDWNNRGLADQVCIVCQRRIAGRPPVAQE